MKGQYNKADYSRRNLIKLVGFGFVALTFIYCQRIDIDTAPPNIVLILTDDQGYGDIRSHGNEKIDTPVMDSFAEQGARFERFYVSSVCAPTRASLLTGKYFLRTNVRGVMPMYSASMRTEEVTIAEVLKQAGYTTGIFGKWHLGDFYPEHPYTQGFDEFLGFRPGAYGIYFDPPLEYYDKISSVKVPDVDLPAMKQHIVSSGHVVQKKGYITDILTDQAMQFMTKNKDKPFFCYIPYNAPHTPIQVPDRLFDKYKARGFDNKTAGIYGMVENIDENIDRLLKKLDELELSENTIVLFLSDNGALETEGRFNSGMRGYKGSVDEGATRVPLFVRWPGKIKAGSVIEEPAAHIDLFPTILEICNLNKPNDTQLDGMSFLPLLKGQKVSWPDRKIFDIRLYEDEESPLGLRYGTVRTNRWRLTVYPDHNELYDMIIDFGQEHDIVKQNPDVEKELHHAFQEWYKDIVRDGLARPPIPVGYDYESTLKLPSRYVYLHGNLSATGKLPWDRDWVYNWATTDDYIWWDVDVAKNCSYEATLIYSCAKINAGSKIQLVGNSSSLEAVIHAKPDSNEYKLVDHNRVSSGMTGVKFKTTQRLGTISLKKGRTNLYLKALDIPGTEALMFHRLELRLIE